LFSLFPPPFLYIVNAAFTLDEIGKKEAEVLTTFWVLIIPVFLASVTSPPPRQFVPGEVLVKFSPGTKESASVAKANEVSPPDLAALNPAIEALEAGVGVPLKPKQLSSASWLLLEVRLVALTKQVVQQLRTRKNIEEVRIAPCKLGAPAPGPSGGLVIEFEPASPEAEAVMQKLSKRGGETFDRLISALEGYVDLPLEAKAIGEDAVSARIDLKALTLILVKRLKALEEIESAQPNYILTLK
jgi:hypothetical protein